VQLVPGELLYLLAAVLGLHTWLLNRRDDQPKNPRRLGGF
jgi:hypothetical protein